MHLLVHFKCMKPSLKRTLCSRLPLLTLRNLLRSPISLAFASRSIDTARLLYSYRADVDCADTEGWTPLFYLFVTPKNTQTVPYSSDLAIRESSSFLEYLQFLSSSSDLDIETADDSGLTVLHHAAGHGWGTDIFDLLRFHASDSVRGGPMEWLPIFEAVYNSNVSTFHVLADHRPDYFKETDLHGWSLLHIAAAFGCREIIARLLRDGADIHALSEPSATMVLEPLIGSRVSPLDVAKAVGRATLEVLLGVLCAYDEEVRAVWDGNECDVFFPVIAMPSMPGIQQDVIVNRQNKTYVVSWHCVSHIPEGLAACY